MRLAKLQPSLALSRGRASSMSTETPPLEDSLPPDEEASGIRTPLWASCTPEDMTLIPFEEPISAVKSATPGELADTYLAAARNGTYEVSCRVYELLGDLLNLHLTAEDRSSPFGPILSWSDGRRTAIPTDFSAIKETIAAAGQQASNPVLRARLNDVAWVLDRKRWQSALSAIDAYCEVVRQVRARLRTHCGSQNVMVAAMQIAEKKACAHRS